MGNGFIIENAYALLIGVGSEGIELTVKDAIDVYDVIRDPGRAGYPEKNISLLTNEKASRQGVMDSLAWLQKQTNDKEDAMVLIYYSGHGGRFTSPTDGREHYYLLTHGFNERDPDDTMISGEVFSDLIDKIKAQKVLVLLDCCYAAGMKSRSAPVMKTAGASAKLHTISGAEFITQLHGGSGRVFISSCNKNELSVILPDASNSLFTQVTLEALQGAASGQAPVVKVIDLLYHVLREVPNRLIKYNHDQHPVINEVIDLNALYAICLNKYDATSLAIEKDEVKEKFIKNYPEKIRVQQVINYHPGSVTNIEKLNGDIHL